MGGLGPASTVDYYMDLVKLCHEEYGEEVYPQIVIDSVDLGIHTEYFNQWDYKIIGDFMISLAEKYIRENNADALLLGCT